MPRPSRSLVRDSLSVSLASGLSGVAFGAASSAAGFSLWQTCLFSLLTFSGASQFAAVGVLVSGGMPLAAISTAGLLGTRNALYGFQMAPRLGNVGWRKVLAAHWTIDESTNVGLAQREFGSHAVRTGFWLTGGGLFLFWNLFTLAGALGAKALGDPAAWGFDAAVPAAFVALLWPRLKDRFSRLVALFACCSALGLTPFLPAGTAIIATVIVAVIAGWRPRS